MSDTNSSAQALRAVIAVNDRFTQQFLKRQLAKQSQRVDFAYADDGAQALEMLSTQHSDLLFLDLDLPILSGLELLELLRSDPAHETLQTFVITSIGLEETVKQAIALGVTDYILRPYQSAAIESRMAQALERARSSRVTVQAQHSTPCVVVADSDPNFCDTMQTALAGDFTVLTASTAGRLLSAVLREHPSCVFLDPTLKGINLKVLLPTIANVRAETAVYFLTDEPGPSGDVTPPVRGYLQRSFVPDALLKSVRALLASEHSFATDSSGWLRTVKPQIASAVKQTFGIMTGREIQELQEQVPPEGLAARLTLTEPDTSSALWVEVVAGKDLCRDLAASMLGTAAEDVESADVENVLGELVNVVAGRVKQDSEDQGWPLSLGLPEVVQWEPSANGKFEHRLDFTWDNSSPFWVLIHVIASE